MDKNYLDDFVCDITCEEYYDDDNDLFWDEQDYAEHMINVSPYYTNEYHRHNFKFNRMNAWEENGRYVNHTYSFPMDWEENSYVYDKPTYECDLDW